jgi:acyl carrier protein
MSNLDKYTKVFTEVFEISKEQTNNLKYQSIQTWDSIGHMGLIAGLESEFKITLEPDDIVDLSSFEKGKEILQKYKIEI